MTLTISTHRRGPDRAVLGQSMTVAHAALPQEIDDRKYRDPDDVERVPETRAKHRKRRRISARKPLANTCAIMVRSQRVPAETCKPWHPTSAKKADRNALREGTCGRAR